MAVCLRVVLSTGPLSSSSLRRVLRVLPLLSSQRCSPLSIVCAALLLPPLSTNDQMETDKTPKPGVWQKIENTGFRELFLFKLPSSLALS